MKITPARRAKTRQPGRAALDAAGRVGITVRPLCPETIYPRTAVYVVTGPADTWSHSANGAGKG